MKCIFFISETVDVDKVLFRASLQVDLAYMYILKSTLISLMAPYFPQ